MKTNVPKLAVLVAVLVVAAGAVGWRSARARAPAKSAPSDERPANDDELAALRRQVRALEDEQSRTRYKVDVALSAKENAGPGAAAVAKPDEDEPATPEELRQRDYERSKHVVDYVQRIMDDEPADVAWAPARVEELRESFKKLELAGFSFKDAECRSTLCRVTINRGTDAITQELGTAIMQLAPFKKMGAFFHYEDDHVVVFSPREGHDFPKDPALARR